MTIHPIPRQFDVARLLVRSRDPRTKKIRAGFETKSAARAEDAKRARLIASTLTSQAEVRKTAGKKGTAATANSLRATLRSGVHIVHTTLRSPAFTHTPIAL